MEIFCEILDTKRCYKDRVTEELKKEMFKKENLTTRKATYSPTKNDGNGTREVFQSLLQVLPCHFTLLETLFVLGMSNAMKGMQDHFSCMKKM